MNAYSTTSQARIQQRDITNILRTHRYTAGAALAGLERHRGYLVEAELRSQLKQNGIEPNSAARPISALRQTIGAALIRAGQHLAGAPRSRTSPEAAPAAGTLGAAG